MIRVYTDYGTGVSENSNLQVEKFVLYRPVPNPFANQVQITFNIPAQKEIKLNIYDVSGRLVRRLIDGRLEKGRYSIVWNGTDSENRKMGSGIYFVKADCETETFTEKIILVK